MQEWVDATLATNIQVEVDAAIVMKHKVALEIDPSLSFPLKRAVRLGKDLR